METSLVSTNNFLTSRETMPDNKLQFVFFIDGSILQIRSLLRQMSCARYTISSCNSDISHFKKEINILRQQGIQDDSEQMQELQTSILRKREILRYYTAIDNAYNNYFRLKVTYENSLNFYVEAYNEEIDRVKWYEIKKLNIRKRSKQMIDISKEFNIKKIELNNLPELTSIMDMYKVPYQKYLTITEMVEEEAIIFNIFSKHWNIQSILVSDKMQSILNNFLESHWGDFQTEQELADRQVLQNYEKFFAWLFQDVNFNDKRDYEQKMDSYVKYLLESTPIDFEFK